LCIDNREELGVNETTEKYFEECDNSLFKPTHPSTEGDYIDV